MLSVTLGILVSSFGGGDVIPFLTSFPLYCHKTRHFLGKENKSPFLKSKQSRPNINVPQYLNAVPNTKFTKVLTYKKMHKSTHRYGTFLH